MSNFLRNSSATTNQNGGTHTATVDTRYVRLRENTDGWLKIQPTSSKEMYICEYTKVTMVKSEGGRTYFKVMDGWSAVGLTASLSDANAREFLTKTPPSATIETVKVKYGPRNEEVSPFKGPLLQQWATLNIRGQAITVTLNSDWSGQYSPIPAGSHRIMAPDASHAGTSTQGYRNTYPGRIKANDVWFPIELAGTTGNSTRYVHIGHLSHGCVTVHQIELWNVVYNFLISHRLPNTNGKYVALLEVTK
ncbi:hypothetical protein [Paraburkholderia solisilvae]|uniref:YkuD domain-containing protein n=1 Tax=Paraburkholderia solisilvae TaxID=624376 RepID=A0A6J5DYC7_9BURK|nr:hypothetical protein [Paraburkholderia solisilvae]CAB3759033.1 hypothetical protein LMG29739_03061 [Paraburkholderia solisilvae]